MKHYASAKFWGRNELLRTNSLWCLSPFLQFTLLNLEKYNNFEIVVIKIQTHVNFLIYKLFWELPPGLWYMHMGSDLEPIFKS
jgi:hypothetical protein